MRSVQILLLPALLATGCIAEQTPVRLLNAFPIERPGSIQEVGTCARTDGVAQYAGSLDVDGSLRYLIDFEVESQLQSIETTVGGNVIDGDLRNVLYLTRMELLYASNPADTYDAEFQTIHFTIQPNTEDNRVMVDLIGPLMAQRLLAGNVPPMPFELLVSFRLTGYLASNPGQLFATNTVTFPITLFSSGFAGCAPGDQLPSGPCGFAGGQDGTRVACCSALTAAGENNPLCP